MKQRRVRFLLLLGTFLFFFHGQHAYSAYDCTNSDMSGSANCLFYGTMGTVGGTITSPSNTLIAANMHPWQGRSDIEYWHDFAVSNLTEGTNYRNSLLLLGVTPDEGTPLGHMLLYPEDNYETAGFITFDDSLNPTTFSLGDIEQKLLDAIATFAYELYINYPGAETNLLNAIKTLANIYLMIGDEFLIDSLEWRFSSQTLGLEDKLAEQILLLTKARLCYDKAVNVFIHGFSPAVGTSIYISDYFDSAVFNLFHLAVERLSTSMREITSKELARQIAPGTETSAMNASREMLKDTYTNTYLLTAAVAQKQGSEFVNNGGKRLYNALKALENQSKIYISGLNPLGFDNRYVPMQDFNPTLYNRAQDAYNAAVSSNSAFEAESREFDSLISSLKDTHNNISTNVYRNSLANLTGIPITSITPSTLDPVAAAGDDLYDCDIDDDNFTTCMQDKTGGVLGTKYTEIRNAQLRVDQALLRRDQALESIEMENTRHNKMLAIENKYNSSYKDALEEFYKKLKGARTIERVRTQTHGTTTRNKEKKTITTYNIENPTLNISTDKEIKFQELLLDYKITSMETNHEVNIMNMLHSLAETEIQIGLSVQLKNSAVNDFENSLKERDNLLFLYKKSSEYYQYTESEIIEKICETRIMRSEAALNLARDINTAVLRTYLAAKALEFKYLTPLENISMDGGQYLDINDLYKIQTTHDLDIFLNNLMNYDTCSWGSVSPRLYRVSLARDILGLNDSYLESLGAVTTAEKAIKKYELLQAFLSDKIDPTENDLAFNFSLSLTDEIIAQYGKYNMKVWWGTASPPCDPVEAKGITVMINTYQAASLEPYVTLTLSGTQSFLNENEEIFEYVPVSNYLNMQSTGTDNTIITKGSFDAFINEDPDAANMNEWSNSFKGRSLTAAGWHILIEDFSYPTDIDWSKVTDITFYFDTMAMQLP